MRPPLPTPRRLPWLLAAGLLLPALASAQRYQLKDGTILSAADLTIGSGALVQQVKIASGGSFERRYPFADIVRMDFPEPPELDQAREHVAAGRGPEALALIEPIYSQFAPFPKTPGSHWPRASELRLRALLLGEDTTAITTASRELIQSGLGPETTGLAKLALAKLDIRAGRADLANIMLDEIAREAPPEIQARAWLLRGDLAQERSAFTEALEAYLRIPAFYGTLDELMPTALLGAARAYRGYGDSGRAERSALDLIDTYPDTLEATTARKEFDL
jgi:hypothetical protein